MWTRNIHLYGESWAAQRIRNYSQAKELGSDSLILWGVFSPSSLPSTYICSSRFCKKTNITTKIQMLGSFFLFQPYHLCENQPFWPRDLDCSQPSSGSLLPSCIFEPSQGKKRQHRPQSGLGIHNYPVWKCHNDRTLRCQYVFIHITYNCIHIYMLFLSAINICCA